MAATRAQQRPGLPVVCNDRPAPGCERTTPVEERRAKSRVVRPHHFHALRRKVRHLLPQAQDRAVQGQLPPNVQRSDEKHGIERGRGTSLVENGPGRQGRLPVESPRGTLLDALVPAVRQEELPTAGVPLDPPLHRRRRPRPQPRRAYAPGRFEQHVRPGSAMDEGVNISALVGQDSHLDLRVAERQRGTPGATSLHIRDHVVQLHHVDKALDIPQRERSPAVPV